MNEEKQFQDGVLVAQVKFGIIAPVIQGLFPDATKTAYYKRVAQAPVTMPDGRQVQYQFNAFEKWEAAYRRDGFDGLFPKPRSDSGIPRNLPDTAIAEIYRLKGQFPKANATMIYHKLIAEGFLRPEGASLSTVQRFIKNNDLKELRVLNAKDRKAFEEEFPCMMYQADTCHSVYITENGVKRKTYLIHVVDDYSRLIVGARFFYEDNSYNFQQVLKEAIARFGLCKKLYCDHGSTYENGQLKKICIAAGIVELHAPVRDGAAKAKVERSFRTIKDTWLHGFDTANVDSLAQLNTRLQDYVNMRNNSINRDIGCTPLERYRKHMDKVRFPKSREWLEECFMNRIIRKVANDSTISIDKVSYDVPMQFIAMKVEVRFLPDRMGEAYLFYEGRHYPVRKTDRVENCHTKRNTPAIDYSRKEA